MMVFWMAYVAVITLIMGVAGLVVERAAQLRKAPTRPVWIASLLASLILPVASFTVPVQTPGLSSAIDRAAPQAAAPLRRMTAAAVQPSAWLVMEPGHIAPKLDVNTLLVWGWGATSGLMLLAILFNGALLHLRKRSWRGQLVAGSLVLVSEDFGPAVVGLLRPSIVLPQWIAEAPPQTQSIVVAHEQSHLDAKDTQLLAVALLLILAMPWNLPLWWQLRRLRAAIEMDCDSRVLREGASVAAYGETLVLVGERQSSRFALATAMSEPTSFLEHRIRNMLAKRKKSAWASATALAALGSVVAASAVLTTLILLTPVIARASDPAKTQAARDLFGGAVDLSGAWDVRGSIGVPGKAVLGIAPTCEFQQAGSRLAGVCKGPNSLGTAAGAVDGGHVSWRWEATSYTPVGLSGLASFEGEIGPDDVIRGTWKFSSAPSLTGEFTQLRRSAAPLPTACCFSEQTTDGAMKRYRSSQWGFALDVPKRWNAFPANLANSPNEVVRFASGENGTHLMIVFRSPNDPVVSPEERSKRVQQILAKAGFSNFVSGETRIGSKVVRTLDFDISRNGQVWSCRHYFITDGTLVYVLGFGTTNRKEAFGVFDQMAKSFVSGEAPNRG
jgi:beta-lactamase regulating signal transducer with metallopeptidase domain